MAARESQGQKARDELARALARWDNEGGAVHPEAAGQAALGAVEKQILQCLGAAVIAQWNDLPTAIQRQLFRRAVSMDQPRNAGRLKQEIARFLHNHKDDGVGWESASDEAPGSSGPANT
jgi:hypothetical protein